MISASEKVVTAAMLAIGDELLSGRTRDKNIGHLATALTLQGIDLMEVRIVPDDHEEIVNALNALRSRYDHVFTSGGIGPTHDDITADAVSAAFGVAIDHDSRAMEILTAHYKEQGLEFTTARKRMARIPVGASLIPNKVSRAPGFTIGNVNVMAGVPSIFQAMLEEVLQALEGGAKMQSISMHCPFGEGTVGDELAEIQKRHPKTSIGSYPKFDGHSYFTNIVVRGRDLEPMEAAAEEIRQMLQNLDHKEQ